jgi:hypothetical protein
MGSVLSKSWPWTALSKANCAYTARAASCAFSPRGARAALAGDPGSHVIRTPDQRGISWKVRRGVALAGADGFDEDVFGDGGTCLVEHLVEGGVAGRGVVNDQDEVERVRVGSATLQAAMQSAEAALRALSGDIEASILARTEGATGRMLPGNGMRSCLLPFYAIGRSPAGDVPRMPDHSLRCHHPSSGAHRRDAMEATPPKVNRVPKISMLPESSPRSGFVTEDRYANLADCCAKVGLWLRAMFEVGYTFGWRSAEVEKLQVRQVEITECRIMLDAGST